MPLPVIARWKDVGRAEWNDWRWQLRNCIGSLEALRQVVRLTPEEEAGFAATLHEFRMSIPPYYAALIDPEDPTCPVRLMSVPRVEEAIRLPEELRDPLAE